MTPHPALLIKKEFLQAWLGWFQNDFRQNIVSLIEAQFPGYRLPAEVRAVLEHCAQIWKLVDQTQSYSIDLVDLFETVHGFENQSAGESVGLLLFKQIILRCRRQRAAYTEGLREKTFHTGLTQTLDEEINTLDAVVQTEWFEQIGLWKLPRAGDFLPIQYIEQSSFSQLELAPRQYDEKFHILQAPALFLPDLAYFRAKCEVRGAPLTIAFLDIDDFKRFNTLHSETKVDRNVFD